jgi:hypothetical protein
MDVVLGLAEDICTPRSLSVAILIRFGEWAELQKLRCRPRHYVNRERYYWDNVITDILRKCDLPSTVDRQQAAVDTFFMCEKKNYLTNCRLARFLPNSLFLEDGDEAVYDFICHWRKEVISVMGNLPDHLTPRFGGGATYADTGLLITTPDKMSSRPTIYFATECLLPMWGETSWSRSLVETRPWQSRPRAVRGNKFFTVPKDGTKFRGCCKEASIPVSYQLDVGRILKSRLLRIGIDLREGQELHRALAKRASEDGSLATIDMSNASDTLARVLVRLLLRGDWFELLNSLRATHTRIEGQWHRLEKFSSMGNGFTFELETIVFVCLARTLVRLEGGDPDLVKCYGDDLIVPSRNVPSLMKALELFGFEPNMEKTFVEGPFRESCGGDFWDGVPVRAHYIQELPDEPQQWISLANGLRRLGLANGSPPSRWGVVRRTWLRTLDHIPSNIRRCRGPEHLGDVVIHDTDDRWDTKRMGADSGWDQITVPAYIPVPDVLPWGHWNPAVQLACCTLGFRSIGVSPRDGISGYRVKRIPVRGLSLPWAA